MIDLKQRHRELFTAPAGEFAELEAPPLRYLGIDGHGDPNTAAEYADAVAALYAAAYGVRAALKARTGDAFGVGPLEGLWSSVDPDSFTAGDKASWDWTMLFGIPAEASEDDVASGLGAAAAKKRELPVTRVRVRNLDEGLCLQALHVGSYDDEAALLRRLHEEVMPGRGLTWNGPHHEIYLGDPRRTEPAKLKTLLRQPVRPL